MGTFGMTVAVGEACWALGVMVMQEVRSRRVKSEV
jgi:hypothetical protein